MGDGGHCGLFMHVNSGLTAGQHLHLPCTLAGPSAVAMLCKGLLTIHTGLRNVNGRQGIRALRVELRRGRESGRGDCLSVHVMCFPCLLDFTSPKSLMYVFVHDSFKVVGKQLGGKMTAHGTLAVL